MPSCCRVRKQKRIYVEFGDFYAHNVLYSYNKLMLVRKRRRKLLYPGGLISLSLLPFLFFASNQRYIFREPLRALEVTYWDLSDLATSPTRYVNKKFTKIVLTGG